MLILLINDAHTPVCACVCVCMCLGGDTTLQVTFHAPATIAVACSAGLVPRLDQPDPSKFDPLIDIIITTDRLLHCVLIWFWGKHRAGVDQTVRP